MARTAKEKAYLTAAENSTAPAMTEEAKAQEIDRHQNKLRGLDEQMREVGAKLKAAKASRDAAAQSQHEALLLENFRLRGLTVAALRGLGATVNDPYVD